MPFVHTIMAVSYVWDPDKAANNLKKHGVEFADAVGVLEDELALVREDVADYMGENEMLEEYDFSQAKRGPVVPPAPNKTRITIRIDTDILNWFREQVNASGGGSYQTLINQALREYIQNQGEDWEATLRRVIREELQVQE